MTINGVGSYQATSLYAKGIATKTEGSSFAIPETATATKSSAAVYEELSGKYDVRNATFEEIVEISNVLYDAGEITLKEHAVITFDFERATNYLKQNAPGYVSPDFNMYKTPANSSGQRDWIAEFSARAADHFKFGNIVGYQMNSKVLSVFERLSR